MTARSLNMKIKENIRKMDIKYELRLLLGAERIIQLIEINDSFTIPDEKKFGSIVNYFKDSLYIHSRNLLNLLTREVETDLGKIPSVNSKLYAKLKRSIEKFVLYLNTERSLRAVK